jgi:hypothetical protein
MEALRTSETLVYFIETTRRYIPEACHLHTRRRQNLIPHYIIDGKKFKGTRFGGL